MVKQLNGNDFVNSMPTNDGYLVVHDNYYLPQSNNAEVKISVLDCESLQVTELTTFHADGAVDDGGMFLGLDNWVYISQGASKNHRIKASSMAIEEYLLVSDTREEGGWVDPSSFYQNENGIYRFFTKGNRLNNGILTEVEKYSGEEVSIVATSEEQFIPYISEQPPKTNKVYAFSPTANQDVMYFDMNTESFVELEVIPGKDSLSVGNLPEDSFLIDTSEIIYLKGGMLGADMTIINTACNKTDICNYPLGSSPPTVVNQQNYDFTPNQTIYIPIRAKDPDDDLTSYKLINAPNWIDIKGDLIVGKVPDSAEFDIDDIILQIEDSNNNSIKHYFSFSYRSKKELLGEISPKVSEENDASEGSNDNSSNNQSQAPVETEKNNASGGGSFSLAAIMLLLILCFRLKVNIK